MAAYYLKTNRVFTPLRKYAWLFIVLTALGGLWYPKLGLLIVPVMLFLAVLGFMKGKYWCGNYCPHGSLFDQYISILSLNKKIPPLFKSTVFRVLAFSWFGYMLTIRLVRVAALWGDLPFWDRLGFIFVMNYLVVTIAGTILAFLVSPRSWCSFCPMGTLQKITYTLGKWTGSNLGTDVNITVSSPDMCHSCATCARVCPMQLEPFKHFGPDNQFISDECIRCSSCVTYCPAGILTLETKAGAAELVAAVDTEGYENRQRIAAKVAVVTDLGRGVWEFQFDLENPPSIHYKAGQFILAQVQEQPEVWRAYSISNLNSAGDMVRITVRNNPEGYGTPLLFEKRPGDSVLLEGPMGNELVVDKNSDRVVLVAGGIGITPFVPLVQDLVEGENAIKEIVLVYGVNKPEEFLYEEYFRAMDEHSPKFKFVPVVAFDEKWQGERGFVTDYLQKTDLADAKIYMCGPKPMIGAVISSFAHREDVDGDRVFYESA